MIGTSLARYSLDPFCILDCETEGLNLGFHRPWQLSYAIATLKGGIQSIKTELIRWPNLVLGEDNPSFKHFDRARYEREARDPRAVWAEFAPHLYQGRARACGHNVIGYDANPLAIWQRGMGVRHPDHSWIYRNGGALDTYALSKAFRMQWVPDISSPDAFVAWQYRAYHERLAKGIKTKLGVMCAEFGIEYDEHRAHDAQYDIERNWLVARELIHKVEC